MNRVKNAGFTLIEIMVVMIILSFSLVALVGAMAQATRSTSTIADLEALRQAAEEVLASQLTPEKLRNEREEGVIRNVKWIMEVKKDPEIADLRHVEVTTFLGSRPNGRRFTIVTRQLSPALAERG